MILQIKNLAISFQKNQVVKNISFSLSAKKITALVGQSGSGKSVTALAIVKLLSKAEISGEIIFAEKNLLELSEEKLCQIRGREIGFIFQDPNTSLNPLHKIGVQIAEAITIHNAKITKKNLQKRIAELLKMVELESLATRLNDYPHQLSGGQKQRVMIAIALANNPKILIADEPTTALDVTVANDILNLILRLKNELGIAVLFITHNLRAVRKIADEVIEMKEGKVSQDFSQPPSLDRRSNDLMSLTARDPRSCSSRMTIPVLTAKNLSVSYQIKKSFLKKENFYANRDLNFSLNLGENLGVIGESGSGKSTLALALLGLIKSQGEINFFPQPNSLLRDLKNHPPSSRDSQNHTPSFRDLQNYTPSSRDLQSKSWRPSFAKRLPRFARNDEIKIAHNDEIKKLRRDVQIIFQDPFSSLNPRMLVKDIIAEGLLIHKTQGDVEAIMKRLHLDLNLQNRYPHQLSGGQRQRVAIARALILNPQILILDEPTSALDWHTQNEILKLLGEIQSNQKISYILISHDLEVVSQIADRIMVLKAGQIVELGEKSQIINSPKEAYTKTLISNF